MKLIHPHCKDAFFKIFTVLTCCTLVCELAIAQEDRKVHEARAMNYCNTKLSTQGVTISSPKWKELMNSCVNEIQESWAPPNWAGENEKSALGKGPIAGYLSKILEGDFTTAGRMDHELNRAHQSLFGPLIQSYIYNYPKQFGNCLEASAASVTAGRSYYEITRDGNGVERSRRLVDNRHQVQVNQRFLPMARLGGERFGLSPLVGIFKMSNVDTFITELMSRFKCDDPTISRLEEQLISYWNLKRQAAR